MAEKPSPCDPDLAGPDYVGGVDVQGNRIAPADLDGGIAVDLSQVSATPVLEPGGRRPQMVVQGVKLVEPACASEKHDGRQSKPAKPH